MIRQEEKIHLTAQLLNTFLKNLGHFLGEREAKDFKNNDPRLIEFLYQNAEEILKVVHITPKEK